MTRSILSTAALTLTLFASQAGAAQFGANLSFFTGDADVEGPGNGDIEELQFGVVLNTGSRNTVFNYRLNVNYVDGDVDTDFGPEVKLNGIQANNTFGFRVGGNERMRLWAGPSVNLGLLDADAPGFFKEDAVRFEFGGTFGADFSMNNNTQLSVEGGLMFGTTLIDTDITGDGDVEVDTTTFMLKGSVLFGQH